MRLTVRIDTSRLDRKVRLHEKLILQAATDAINDTAAGAVQASVTEMRRVFDRPTPYALRSLYVRKATRAKLRAVVRIKDFGGKGGTPAANFLRPGIRGGHRNAKRFEVALERIGILPPGWRAVPADGVPLDQYGNPRAALIVQIMSYLQAFGEQGYKANSTEKSRERLKKGSKRKYGKEFFVSYGRERRTGRGSWADGRGNHLHPGIWLRQIGGLGSSIRPMFMFVPTAQYRPRFDYRGTVHRYASKAFRRALARSLAQLSGGALTVR